jgi:UDP:flavonoid glycosyltransferase YjiC (YdhE family)
MRMCIIAPGSRGDVQPYVALGKGLVEAGHLVRLVTFEDFGALVRENGIEFWPLKSRAQEIVTTSEMRKRIESGSFLAVLRQMVQEAQRGAVALTKVGLAACEGMDRILAGIGGLYMGLALAEKLELPLVQAYYIPFTPTRAYPSFIVPKPPSWFGGALNRLSHHVARQMMWQGFRSADKLARKQVLGLPAAPFWGPFDAHSTRGQPVLYGYSPSVIPPAPDWDANTYVTGYWFLDPPADWAPPAKLVEFLQDGPPPIYVGFGSMSSRAPEKTAALVLNALERAQQRAIVLTGWSGMRATTIPETVYMVDSVPFSWLFARVAAVVHHGGAGTTSAGFRAGVPSIVVPFFGDQPFWGQRAAQLGVGPEPIPRQKLTVERLAQAIQTAVTDGTMRQRAADLGTSIRAEDGVSRAVARIGQLD